MLFPYWLLVFILGQTFISASTNETPCNEDEFPCDFGGCVLRRQWCDSFPDCADKSDESYCYTYGNIKPECKLHHFQCRDLTCIPINARCDRLVDCKDGSDEEKCINVKLTKKQTYPQRKVPIEKQSASQLALNNFQMKLESLRKCEEWILDQQKKDGWGEKSARVIVALYMSNLLRNVSEETLMKHLTIQIAADILRNSSKNSNPSNLALNILALLASCQNPRNFQGLDLVQSLRFQTDAIENVKELVPPVIFLALCLMNETKHADFYNLYTSLTNSTQKEKLEHHALALMAMYCIARNNKEYESKYLEYVIETAKRLKRKYSWVRSDVYSTALVIQGLMSVSPHFEWDESETVAKLLSYQKTDGSFGDFLSTYYALPVLAGKTLLSLKSINCSRRALKRINPMELPASESDQITVRYNLWLGSPVVQSHAVNLKVSSEWSFFEIMKFAAEQNNLFSFKYEQTNDGPQVFSVTGIPNDAEKEFYWSSYKLDMNSGLSSTNMLGLGLTDKVSEGDNLVFWFKHKSY